MAATILLTLALLHPPGDAPMVSPAASQAQRVETVGLATHYAPGLMERVATYRERFGQLQPCPECFGDVALGPAQAIGSRVYARIGGRTIGPLRVVDCGGADYGGQALELSYELWQALGLPERPVDAVVSERGG